MALKPNSFKFKILETSGMLQGKEKEERDRENKKDRRKEQQLL